MGDLVLHGEDVSHLTVVGLRPEGVSVPGVGQLRRHAQAVCGPAHAPAEHGRHLQRLTDLPHVLVLPHGRATTWSWGSFESALMSSSLMPSLRYSSCGAPLT